MENIRFDECDSFDEVAKIFNTQVKPELDRLSGAIAQNKENIAILSTEAIPPPEPSPEAKEKITPVTKPKTASKQRKVAEQPLAEAKVAPKAKGKTLKSAAKAPTKRRKAPTKRRQSKKKGSVLKGTLIALVVLVLAVVSFSAYVPGDINYEIASNPEMLVQYLEDSFGNITSNSYLFTPTDTAPTAAEGKVYYKDSANTLYLYTGSAWEAIDVAGGLSLDGAYDVGTGITVDAGAVVLTAPNANDNTALQIIQQDTTTALGLDIDNAGTGNSIDIQGQSSAKDIEGTDDTWSVSTAGVGSFAGLIVGATDIVFVNSETIDNDNDGEITFSDATDDTAISWSGSTLQWTTDTSIDTVSWGDLDAHTGLTDITGDTATFTIGAAGDATGEDVVLQQTGTGDNQLKLISTGTATDAIAVTSSAGITMTSTVEASVWTQTATGSNDDLTISVAGAYDASLILSSAGTGADAVSIFTSHANGDIKILSTDTIDIDAANGIAVDIAGGSGQDYVLTNTLGSIILEATEASADAIVIKATTAVGGIDIQSQADVDIITTGESGEDITLANTGGSVVLTASEVATDAITITASAGGITMASADVASAWTHVPDGTTDDLTISVAPATSLDSSLILTSAGSGTDALTITTVTNAGDISIVSNDKITTTTVGTYSVTAAADDMTFLINTSASGGEDLKLQVDGDDDCSIILDSDGTAADAIIIYASNAAGGIDVDAGTYGINMKATGGDIKLENTTAKDIILDATAGRVLITGTESAADAIVLIADGANGEISLAAKVGGIDIDAVGGDIKLDVSGAGKDIILDATEGAIKLDGGETGAVAIVIDASHSGGGIDMDFGSGGYSLVGGSGDMVLTLAGAAGDVFTLTNTTGTGTGAIELTATAGSLDINAKEQIMIDLASGTAGTSNIIVTNTPGTDENAIELEATAGGITLIGNAAKNIALNAGQILIESEESTAAAIQLLTNTGTGETILITNTLGNGAGAIALAASAGGITATVQDGKDLKLGNEGAETYIIVATHASEGSEDIRLINGTGTDNGAIELTATAGGIAAKAADGKLIKLSDSDGATYFQVAPHGTASTEILSIINAKGTAAGSIVITSSAGGIDLNSFEMFTVNVAGGTAGTADIVLTNSIGTSDDSIEITTTTGGIDINAKSMLTLDVAAGAAGTTLITVTNTPGTDDAAIAVDAVAGGIDIEAAKSIVLTSEEAQADAIQITTSNGAGGIVLTSGLGTISFSDDDVTNMGTLACNEITDDDDSAISYQIKTVTVQIEHVGGSGDFQWSTGAGHAAQNLDLSTIVPAYARVLDVTVICTESVVGQSNVLLTIGNQSAGNEFIAQADCDTLNGAISSAAAGASFVAINTSASNVWVGADPDDGNWTDQSAGTWAVMVTYIDNNAAKDN